jgi:glycosyltransferase involved in cell wall biosynthesis
MYQGAVLISETIDSLINQTFKDWEMIVVDDCSPDGGAGIAKVREYMKKDSRIRLIPLDVNKGSSGARNEGIRAAQGDYIAFLDADDLWSECFLEKQLAFLKARDAAIVYSSYKRIDEKNKRERLTPFIVPEKVNYKKILKSLPIFPSTAVINIKKIGKFYFDENMGCMRDDYVFWLHILKNHVDYAYGNKEILACYRMRSDSVTANKLKVIRPHWNVLRNVEQMPFLKSAFYLFCWACISIRKYCR